MSCEHEGLGQPPYTCMKHVTATVKQHGTDETRWPHQPNYFYDVGSIASFEHPLSRQLTSRVMWSNDWCLCRSVPKTLYVSQHNIRQLRFMRLLESCSPTHLARRFLISPRTGANTTVIECVWGTCNPLMGLGHAWSGNKDHTTRRLWMKAILTASSCVGIVLNGTSVNTTNG